jgi:hypothetical protein
MRKKIKIFGLAVFVTLSMLGLVCVLLQGLYNPFRLYFSGENMPMKVQTKKTEIEMHRNGPIVTGQYIVAQGCSNKLYVPSKKLFNSIKEGDLINTFFSEELNSGIVVYSKSPSLFTCILASHGYFSIILALMGIILLFFILKRAYKRNMIEIVKRLDIIKDEVYEEQSVASNKNKTSNLLSIGKKVVPDLTLVTFAYILSIIAIHSVLFVESSGKLETGFVIFCSILIISYFPWLTLVLRRKISNTGLIKNTISFVKISTGVYGIIKTLMFIYYTPFEYSNFSNMAYDYVKYLIGS